MPLFTYIKNFLFPKRCVGCGKRAVTLCTHCVRTIPLANPLDTPYTYAVFEYGNNFVRDAVWALKYRKRAGVMEVLVRESSGFITEYLAEHIQSSGSLPAIVLVPVPQYRSRTHNRGYNQSALIARWLSTAIQGASVKELLTKHRKTLPQAQLSRTRRLHNIVGSMQCSKTLDPKTIYIIIDDVTTTGATLAEARRALHAEGAKKVFGIAIAHGYAHK